MTTNETSNVIEILRLLGWNGDQISDFLLGIEGRITISETADRIQKNSN